MLLRAELFWNPHARWMPLNLSEIQQRLIHIASTGSGGSHEVPPSRYREIPDAQIEEQYSYLYNAQTHLQDMSSSPLVALYDRKLQELLGRASMLRARKA